jgi:hypothetical protein
MKKLLKTVDEFLYAYNNNIIYDAVPEYSTHCKVYIHASDNGQFGKLLYEGTHYITDSLEVPDHLRGTVNITFIGEEIKYVLIEDVLLGTTPTTVYVQIPKEMNYI